jgi:hypothetical protein
MESKQETWSALFGPASLWVAGAISIALADILWESLLVLLVGLVIELRRNRLQVVSSNRP